MAKIAFDKYYTPPTVARFCIDKVKELIGEENITEWVEPSAGSGSFSHQLLGCKAYDLYPQHDYIEQQDFLELQLDYKEGRCFIGNPPFGGGAGRLIKQFYNKATEMGDYIAYIQPASFYNSYSIHKKFEIIYSCILVVDYTNQNLKTSFTIYKRNPEKDKGYKFENTDYSFPCIKHLCFSRENDKNGKKHKYPKIPPYDYSFVSYGDLLKEAKPYQFVKTETLRITDEEFKDEIISFFKWLYWYNKETKIMEQTHISSSSINMNNVYKLLRIAIPELNKKYPIKNEDRT